MLVANNDTRWNSTYGMIRAAVKQREKALLEPFKDVTMIGQEKGSCYGSIASTLWGFDIPRVIREGKGANQMSRKHLSKSN